MEYGSFYKWFLPECPDWHVGGVCNYFFLCIFYFKPCGEIFRFPDRPADRPANHYYFCNSDFYGGIPDGAGEYSRCISWLWIYRSVHPGLSDYLLQKFCDGSSGAVVYCRSCSAESFPADVPAEEKEAVRLFLQILTWESVSYCERSEQ